MAKKRKTQTAGKAKAKTKGKRQIEIEIEGKGKKTRVGESEEFVVVELEYPTLYGCHSGRKKWSSFEFWSNATEKVHGPFTDKATAKLEAVKIRDDCYFFEDSESVFDDDASVFDSADLENDENDSEVRISVKKAQDHRQEVEERDKRMEECEGFVVVKLEYPTLYGIYSGRKEWSFIEFWGYATEKVHGPFTDKATAKLEAVKIRDDCECFDNSESMFDDDASVFDSADLENYDNDSEFRISVKKAKDHNQEVKEREKKRKDMVLKAKKKSDKEQKEEAKAIKEKGKVHYSFPPQPYDIKAEVEINLEDFKKVVTRTEDALKAKYPNAAQVKTLMVKDLIDFGQDGNLHLDPMPKLLQMHTGLNELHWHDGKITTKRLAQVISSAPHLCQQLTDLSTHLGDIDPDAVGALEEFHSLEILSMKACFSLGWYDFDSGLDECPYDEPLLRAVRGMPNLKHLNLVQMNEDSKRYMFKYALSPDCVQMLKCEPFEVKI